MIIRKSTAEWRGDLPRGKGIINLGSGAFSGEYSFHSRFESGNGTNPEELIAAAHAGCFSMALAHGLAQAGHTAEKIETRAEVKMEKRPEGFQISGITLVTRGRVPGIDTGSFLEYARRAKDGCPVSMALASVPITLDAALESPE
jgi:osmotically inducible protein OsmC